MGFGDCSTPPSSYDGESIAYEFTRRPGYGQPIVDFLRRELSPAHLRAVLEVGCGTGFALERLAELKPGRLFGLDTSRPMLARAAERMGPRAALLCAWAEALPFADRSISLLVVAGGSFRSFDQGAFWEEVARVMTPEHRLVLFHRYADGSDDNVVTRFSIERLADRHRKGPDQLIEALPPRVSVRRFEQLSDEFRFEDPRQLEAYLATQLRAVGDSFRSDDLRRASTVSGWPLCIRAVTPVAVLEWVG
jgi:SAM-dependent methyltransferase